MCAGVMVILETRTTKWGNLNQFKSHCSYSMKVMGAGNTESFFSPLKIFLNMGWFIGIFPVKFDGALYSFRYKFLSLTTLFSFMRLAFIILLLISPTWIMDTVDFVAKNTTDNSLNETFDFIGEKGILKNTSDYLLERVELLIMFLNALGQFIYGNIFI